VGGGLRVEGGENQGRGGREGEREGEEGGREEGGVSWMGGTGKNQDSCSKLN
jgi:hypothetical protein